MIVKPKIKKRSTHHYSHTHTHTHTHTQTHTDTQIATDTDTHGTPRQEERDTCTHTRHLSPGARTTAIGLYYYYLCINYTLPPPMPLLPLNRGPKP